MISWTLLTSVVAITEHWLRSFDLYFLDTLHPDFHAWGMSSPNEEDSVYCAPRYRRGHGGAAILWRKNVRKLEQFASHRCMGISIDNSTFIFSVYLPSRTGCTDFFKESLDTLQVIKEKLNLSGLLIIAGDLNADPGTSGGPVSTTPVMGVYFSSSSPK